MAFEYRPEIDGLRAVAVVAVLLFHAGLGVPGGFVGVDVFFVVSGFLITSLIRNDMTKGRFTLSHFWERRARRIVPAAAVVIIAAVIASYLIMMSYDLRDVGKSAVSQSFFAANIHFYRTIDYFTDTSGTIPLLHTWSLAVEEQFYLLFPLVLVLFRRFSKRDESPALIIFLCVVFGLSFLSSVAASWFAPEAGFYLLPTRAWELLIGVLLAYASDRWVPSNRAGRETLGWIGLALIAYSFFAYSAATPFPGLAGVPPCLGTAFFILANSRVSDATGGTGLTSAGRFLSLRPIVFIGLVSYSLYLWHWPVLVLAKYPLFGRPTLLFRAALLAVAFALAIISWRVVERPVRERKLFPSRRGVFLFAVSALALIAAAGVAAWRVVPGRFVREEALIDRHRSELTTSGATDRSARDIDEEHVPSFGVASASRVDLLVWGDSHASASLAAFDEYAKAHLIAGRIITHGGDRPFVGYAEVGGLRWKGPQWADAALRYVARHHVSNVVLVGRWDRELTVVTGAAFKGLLLRTTQRLASLGTNVWIMLDIPTYPTSVPKLLVRSAVTGVDPRTWEMTPAQYRKLNEPFYELMGDPNANGVRFLDPSSVFLDKERNHFVVSEKGSSLYADSDHITIPAAKELLGRMLEEQLVLNLP